MRPLPIRRRGIVFIALSFVFMGLAASRPHHNAYIGIGALLLLVGLATIRRSRRGL